MKSKVERKYKDIPRYPLIVEQESLLQEQYEKHVEQMLRLIGKKLAQFTQDSRS